MSRLLQSYIPILKNIVRMKKARRCTFLKYCYQDIIDFASKCAKNVLNNNVRKLADSRTPLKQKSHILRQKGGFVTSLHVPAIMAIDSIMTSQLFTQQYL